MNLVACLKRLISKAQVLRFAPGHGSVVYFAHSKLDYGTAEAYRARGVIRLLRPDARILDPSAFGPVWNDLVERLGSHDAVYDLVVSCAVELFALEHNGFVGRGVYEEVATALSKGKPVFAIRGGRAWVVRGCQVADPNDYKQRFGRLITEDPAKAGGT